MAGGAPFRPLATFFGLLFGNVALAVWSVGAGRRMNVTPAGFATAAPAGAGSESIRVTPAPNRTAQTKEQRTPPVKHFV